MLQSKDGVAYGIGRPAMNQGYNAKFSFQIEEEVEPTIVGKRTKWCSSSCV